MKRRRRKTDRKTLGTNQRIGCLGFGFPLLMTYALVISNQVTGESWVSFVEVYVPVAVGVVLGISGGLKVARTIKGAAVPAPPEP